MKFILMFIASTLMIPMANAAWYCAGSLYSDEEAKQICPSIFAAQGGWDGVWTSGPFADRVCNIPFAGSICECQGSFNRSFNWKHTADRDPVPTAFMDEWKYFASMYYLPPQ